MRIVQISDLHFGRDRPELLEPLTHSIQDANPDLVAMAGDFVQRARNWQFRAARAFMDGLDVSWMGVPGNHDIPLFNVFARWTLPYAPYHRWIDTDLEPKLETSESVVLGLDTTDPYSWQRGRISHLQIDRIGDAIARESGKRTVVIVAHHPFHHAPDVEKDLMIGAPAALDDWSGRGPHVILSGHLHNWLVEPFVTRKGAQQTLQVHSGTGLSNRLRGNLNDYAILDIAEDIFHVTRMVAAEDGESFIEDGQDTFQRSVEGWKAIHRAERAPREPSG
jgi:hypothetical protein